MIGGIPAEAALLSFWRPLPQTTGVYLFLQVGMSVKPDHSSVLWLCTFAFHEEKEPAMFGFKEKKI